METFREVDEDKTGSNDALTSDAKIDQFEDVNLKTEVEENQTQK